MVGVLFSGTVGIIQQKSLGRRMSGGLLNPEVAGYSIVYVCDSLHRDGQATPKGKEVLSVLYHLRPMEVSTHAMIFPVC